MGHISWGYLMIDEQFYPLTQNTYAYHNPLFQIQTHGERLAGRGVPRLHQFDGARHAGPFCPGAKAAVGERDERAVP